MGICFGSFPLNIRTGQHRRGPAAFTLGLEMAVADGSARRERASTVPEHVCHRRQGDTWRDRMEPIDRGERQQPGCRAEAARGELLRGCASWACLMMHTAY